MSSYWKPTSQLTPSVRPGEWVMNDAGLRVGWIRYAEVDGRRRFIAVTRADFVLGYGDSLGEAAGYLWATWTASRR